MTSSRRAHNTNIIWLNIPTSSISSNQFHGSFCITYGNINITLWHTIFKNDCRNTHIIEKWCPFLTFMIHGKTNIASTRTYHNSPSSSSFITRKIDKHLCRISAITITIWGTTLPQIHFELFLSRSRKSHKQHAQR